MRQPNRPSEKELKGKTVYKLWRNIIRLQKSGYNIQITFYEPKEKNQETTAKD